MYLYDINHINICLKFYFLYYIYNEFVTKKINLMKKLPPQMKCSECNHSNGLFCCLSDTEKDVLSEGKGFGYYKKGQVIFNEGNFAHGVFCVSKGKIKLSKLGKEGKEQITRLANAGEIIGYRAFLNGEVYKATATALEDSYICMISKDKFMNTLGTNGDLSLKLLRLISKDLKTAEEHIVDIAQNTVKERVARSLMEMIETFGFTNDKKTIDVTMTRSEIADMSGTTTESAIRSLLQLKKEKVIDLIGKNIKILNLMQLEKMANVM